MSYMEDTVDWQAVEAIDAWLDGFASQEYKDQPLAQDWARISKVAEELGEAIQAYIGYTGQNPRKGVVNSRDDVLGELADVAMTAILAMQHFTKDSGYVRATLRSKIRVLEKRVPVQ